MSTGALQFMVGTLIPRPPGRPTTCNTWHFSCPKTPISMLIIHKYCRTVHAFFWWLLLVFSTCTYNLFLYSGKSPMNVKRDKTENWQALHHKITAERHWVSIEVIYFSSTFHLFHCPQKHLIWSAVNIRWILNWLCGVFCTVILTSLSSSTWTRAEWRRSPWGRRWATSTFCRTMTSVGIFLLSIHAFVQWYHAWQSHF